jgi:DNA-binding NtrC family response regulator
LTQPLSLLVTSGKIPAVAEVRVDVAANQDSLELRVVEGAFTPVPVSTGAKAPYVLIVDDNRDLLLFLEALMSDHGWRIDTAATAGEAANLATRGQTAAILDFMLPDDDGVGLALQLRERNPELRVIIMSGLPLPPEDELICLEHDFRILYKPFLPETVIELVENPPD